jgi:hypothetical protein
VKCILRSLVPLALLGLALASPVKASEPCVDVYGNPASPSRPCDPQPTQNSWVFRRSYFTHDPTIAAPTGQSYANRAPVYTRPQGEFVRGSYRNSYSQIRVNGQIWDRTWQWESWVQSGSQR